MRLKRESSEEWEGYGGLRCVKRGNGDFGRQDADQSASPQDSNARSPGGILGE